MAVYVTKRSGAKEPLDISKISKVVSWACEDIAGVSASEIEIKTQMQFFDGMKTKDIQESLIKSAHDLISEDAPNYQYVASRLVNYALRKEVYNDIVPHNLYDHVVRVVAAGFYDSSLLDWYTKEEFATLDSWMDHDRDFDIAYAGMEQFRGKYLVKNRSTKEFYETPQIAIMLIAASLFHNYPKQTRLKWVCDLYDAVSEFDVSLPTPIMAGVRTPKRQFSSCVLIEVGDSLNSIIASTGATVKYVANRAGIGLGMGALRGLNSVIRSGDAVHTGNFAFYKLLVSALKSCSQGGVRGGSGTIYHPLWHIEIEDLLVLKNNKGTEDNRIRHVDYGIQFNRLMYERLIEGRDITLFSPKSVPGLYEAFFADQDEFRRLYENAEMDNTIPKKTVPAVELFSIFMRERKDTGRIYIMNVDNVNNQGPFLPIAPVRQSNLCAEIGLPTKPLEDLNDPDGEIALCTLAAQNWGKIRRPEDFKRGARLLVRALNELLDFQDYPVIAAYNSTMARRPLGIGIINFAYFLAKNGITYQDVTEEQLRLIDDYAEAWSYYLIQASVELAEERGACPKSNETKYSMGIVPIDTYSKAVDELTGGFKEPKMDWESLRERLIKSGIYNSTLMALMPSETSAQVSNSTNGVEPPRALVSVKGSKDGHLKQVVPEVRKYKNKYDLLWDQKSPQGYLKIMAVLQKYIDQCISVNTSYNPAFYPDNKIPMSELLQDMLLHYKWGGKTAYYFNTNDQAGEVDIDVPVEENVSLPDLEEEDCDSCKI